MVEFTKVNMKDYYTQRKIIQKLYANDVLYGDLSGSLLRIRDQLINVCSMSLEIQNLRIRIELVKGHTEEECKEISKDISKIYEWTKRILNDFIYSNIDQITEPNTAESIKYSIYSDIQFFDISNIGNLIEIYL